MNPYRIVLFDLDGTRSAKTDIIRYILDQYPHFEKSDFIMIGDRKHDIIGAINTGIHSIGVTYGYGSLEEIAAAKPTYRVRSVEELTDKWMSPVS
ncbi:HAD hydrolase-like protein [Paenibacillus sp. RC67]|uniref:HAD hydrolase-like protein n=1 Tax=Paenibacillus sp. RC67 TaxID=3039392 RepID=UPI0032C2395A